MRDLLLYLAVAIFNFLFGFWFAGWRAERDAKLILEAMRVIERANSTITVDRVQPDIQQDDMLIVMPRRLPPYGGPR